MTPDLTSYDIVLVNTSAGKDSQTMLDYVVTQADSLGIKDRIVAVHCDLGRVEWQGTRELAQAQAEHYGVRFEVVKRTQESDLLEHVANHGKWPGSNTRFCTSDHKRGPVLCLITKLVAERWRKGQRPVRVLNCLGLRAAESRKRASLPRLERNEKASNGKRHVDNWLPIQEWTDAQVWNSIHRSQVPYHKAYDLGMPRLSCVFCIFAPKPALMIAGHHNPELLNDYVDVERRINHTFTKDISLVSIQAALQAGAAIPQRVSTWADCA